MLRGSIWFIERNIHGAWVIYGMAGIKQYYGFNKKDSTALYLKECKKYFKNQDKVLDK